MVQADINIISVIILFDKYRLPIPVGAFKGVDVAQIPDWPVTYDSWQIIYGFCIRYMRLIKA